jgi:hypothetical protein
MGMVIHICNSNYLEVGDSENHSLRPAQAKSQNLIKQARPGGVCL